jgi:choline dehydrogenase-like flavoprotein
VNSAQILLESRSPDFPRGLGNSHGVLGRYLHDHPLAKLVLDVREHLPIAPAVYVTRPSLERTTPLYAAAFMQWTGVFAMARSLAGAHPGRSRSIGFSIFGTMPPTPDDFVELDGARPGNGRSRVRYALRHPPEAIRLLEESRSELVSSFERAGLRPFVRVFRVEAPGVSVHYGGTCRMHASPKFGVVDRHSRVFDVPNVAVADSSVFTTGTEKNPVLTAMTLAARASDRLAAEIHSGDL